MSFDLDTLYKLLPAIYRIHDLEQGDLPLQALLSVIVEQVAVLEEDLAQLYDDQFIETCQEWAIPYIGDLISYRTPHDVLPQSLRVEVANTIDYRRRKGTAALLEQLARDVTGWSVHAVEFFKLLSMTQHVNIPRRGNTLPDLRQREPLELLNTPFTTNARTADVRSVANAHGYYNISNVGIFVWRLGAYSLTNSPAVKVDTYRYLFSPLGNSTQLFNRPQVEQDVTQLSGPLNIAMPISRSMLEHHLDDYYGEGKSVLLKVNGKDVLADDRDSSDAADLPPSQQISDRITVQDLSDVKDADGKVIGWANMPGDKIAIDPVLGRIAFPRGKGKRAPKSLHATFHYGFSADMGGGEYSRLDSFTRIDPITSALLSIERLPGRHKRIHRALNALNGSGVVEVTDNERYEESPTIHVPTPNTVELRAAEGQRPHLALTNDPKKRDNPATPEFLISGEEKAELILNGLLISGGRLRVTGNLSRLILRHCTLVPGLSIAEASVLQDKTKPTVTIVEADESEKVEGTPSEEQVIVEVANDEGEIREADLTLPGTTEIESEHEVLKKDRFPLDVSIIVEAPGIIVEIDRCILGGLRVVEGAKVQITDSIVDATTQHGVAYAGLDDKMPGGTLHVENSTVIGQVHASSMELASNTIFLARSRGKEHIPIHAERRQDGCVRYSYLPLWSRVPRRYHCQPVDEQAAKWMHPQFTSLRYGDPGYCQLSRRNADAINAGADDESEMGAFHSLYQFQRETNLRLRLDEYLRIPLEAGVFYLT